MSGGGGNVSKVPRVIFRVVFSAADVARATNKGSRLTILVGVSDSKVVNDGKNLRSLRKWQVSAFVRGVRYFLVVTNVYVLARGHDYLVNGKAICVCHGAVVTIGRSLFFSLSSGVRRFLDATCYGKQSGRATTSIGNPLSSLYRCYQVLQAFSVATISMNEFRRGVVYLSSVCQVPSRQLVSVSSVTKGGSLFYFILFHRPSFGATKTGGVSYVRGSCFSSLYQFSSLVV